MQSLTSDIYQVLQICQIEVYYNFITIIDHFQYQKSF